MKKLLFSALFALVAFAQTPSTDHWHYGMVYLPSSAATVITPTASAGYIFVDRLMLANTTGSTVTITITDAGTNCNGGTCAILPAVTIPPNTVYTVDLGGVRAMSGVKWSASTANAVSGWMSGRY